MECGIVLFSYQRVCSDWDSYHQDALATVTSLVNSGSALPVLLWTSCPDSPLVANMTAIRGTRMLVRSIPAEFVPDTGTQKQWFTRTHLLATHRLPFYLSYVIDAGSIVCDGKSLDERLRVMAANATWDMALATQARSIRTMYALATFLIFRGANNAMEIARGWLHVHRSSFGNLTDDQRPLQTLLCIYERWKCRWRVALLPPELAHYGRHVEPPATWPQQTRTVPAGVSVMVFHSTTRYGAGYDQGYICAELNARVNKRRYHLIDLSGEVIRITTVRGGAPCSYHLCDTDTTVFWPGVLGTGLGADGVRLECRIPSVLAGVTRANAAPACHLEKPHLERLGSAYGGWDFDPLGLAPKSVVYSVGIGMDATWDEAMIADYGVRVWGFDPTPKAIAFVDNHELDRRFTFTPEGLALHSGNMTFTQPLNPEYVSMRLGEVQGLGPQITAPVNTLEHWMERFGHDHLAILKLDIEGAEFDLLEVWIKRRWFPMDQLLVEFHHRFVPEGPARLRRVLEGLKECGFVVARTVNDQEYTFLNNGIHALPDI